MRFDGHPVNIANGRVSLDDVLAREIQLVKEKNPFGITGFTIPTGLLKEGANIPFQIAPIRRPRSLGDLPSLQRGTLDRRPDEEMRKILRVIGLRRPTQVHPDVVEDEESGESDEKIFLEEQPLEITQRLPVDRIPVLV